MSASALRTNVPTVKVSFNSVNVNTDLITGLDSAVYGGGAGIPVMLLVNTDPIFWIQKDINGQDQLCTTKTFASLMHLTFLVGGLTPSGKVADPFIIAYHDEAGLPVYMPFPKL